ncbi:SGNH hydrolase-type esterase domain-containing protein [Crepidotus variabilis]|uniref:SGNH hydrolase-type esterase domain-containing protein n=1 Tax=Crepidotus variabilis TaxID=179855 RepID=A0A9P6E8X3_9AGAR|nr:SGNH hydrolase-type esterase domain-containing protein [Crepidotus variabilis]
MNRHSSGNTHQFSVRRYKTGRLALGYKVPGIHPERSPSSNSSHSMISLSLVPVLLTLLSLVGANVIPFNSTIERRDDYHWIDTWTDMPQLVESSNMPPSPFAAGSTTFRDTTIRQTLHMSVGAQKIRVVFSNTFGGADLPITAANVALPTGGKAGVAGIQASPIVPITFKGGATSATVPKGQTLTSDDIAFPVQPQQMITVTLYTQQGQATASIDGHPGSRTTTWLQQGNHVSATTVSGSSLQHWYLLSAVQAYVPPDYGSFVILGDSITDGRGSDNDMNNRWPDLLLARLQTNGLTNIGVVNQAAGGNRVLADGLGPSLISRYKRDALTQAGVKWVMIFEGVNDIGTGATGSGTQNQIANQLISAFTQIAKDAKSLGLPIFAATITPFGSSQYGDTSREAARQTVNKWILTSGTFDAVIDFDKFIRNPSNPAQLASQYNSGDYLHPNVAGYQYIANHSTGTPAPTNTPPPTSTSSEPLPPVTTTAPLPAGPKQTHYGQCGGKGYTGPTMCEEPYTCQVESEFWSNCL